MNRFIIVALLLAFAIAGCLGSQTGNVQQAVSSAFFVSGSGFILQPASASDLDVASSSASDNLNNLTIYCTNTSGAYESETLGMYRTNYVYNITTVNDNQTLRFITRATENYSAVNLSSSATNPLYEVGTASNTTALANATGTRTITVTSNITSASGNLTITLQGNGNDTVEVQLNGVSVSNNTTTSTVAVTNIAAGLNNLTISIVNGTTNYTNVSYNDTLISANGTSLITLSKLPIAGNIHNVTITSQIEAGGNISVTLNGVYLGDANVSVHNFTVNGSNLIHGVNNLTFVSTNASSNITNSSITYIYVNPANFTNATLQYVYKATTTPCGNFTNVWNVTSSNVSLTAPLSLNSTMTNSNTSSTVSFVSDPTMKLLNLSNGTYWSVVTYWNGSEFLKVNTSGTYKLNGSVVSTAGNSTSCSNATLTGPSPITFNATTFARTGTSRATVFQNGSMSCSIVRRLTISAEAAGTMTVTDSSGRTIAVFSPGSGTDYYRSMQTDGSTAVIPGHWTSDAIDIRDTDTKTIYVTGAAVNGTGFALRYQYSPDSTHWFNGTTSLANLTNGSVIVPMNDSGNFIRLILNNSNSQIEYPYAVIEAN